MLLLVTIQSSVCCLAVSHPPHIHRASSAKGWPAQAAPGECLPRSSTGSCLTAGRPSLAACSATGPHCTCCAASLLFSLASKQSDVQAMHHCTELLWQQRLAFACLLAMTVCSSQNFQQSLGWWRIDYRMWRCWFTWRGGAAWMTRQRCARQACSCWRPC